MPGRACERRHGHQGDPGCEGHHGSASHRWHTDGALLWLARQQHHDHDRDVQDGRHDRLFQRHTDASRGLRAQRRVLPESTGRRCGGGQLPLLVQPPERVGQRNPWRHRAELARAAGFDPRHRGEPGNYHRVAHDGRHGRDSDPGHHSHQRGGLGGVEPLHGTLLTDRCLAVAGRRGDRWVRRQRERPLHKQRDDSNIHRLERVRVLRGLPARRYHGGRCHDREHSRERRSGRLQLQLHQGLGVLE